MTTQTLMNETATSRNPAILAMSILMVLSLSVGCEIGNELDSAGLGLTADPVFAGTYDGQVNGADVTLVVTEVDVDVVVDITAEQDIPVDLGFPCSLFVRELPADTYTVSLDIVGPRSLSGTTTLTVSGFDIEATFDATLSEDNQTVDADISADTPCRTIELSAEFTRR